MKTIIALIALGSLTGCTSMQKTDPDGSGWKYSSFMNRKTINELSVSKDGGIRMKGYQSTQAENLKAVAEGVADGFIKVGSKAVMPIP